MRTILINLLDSTVSAVDAVCGRRGRSAAIDRAVRHVLDLPPEEHVRVKRVPLSKRCGFITRDGRECGRGGATRVAGRNLCQRHRNPRLCPSCGEPSRGGAICKSCHVSDDREKAPSGHSGEGTGGDCDSGPICAPGSVVGDSGIPPAPCGDHRPCDGCPNREDCKPELWR